MSVILQDLLQRHQTNQSLHWYKSIQEYYFRPEWEMYDTKADSQEKYNVAKKPFYQVL
mgnify:CR=1 FL=1